MDVGDTSLMRRRWLVRSILSLVVLLALVWALIPALRAISLVANTSGRGAEPDPRTATSLPVQAVHFTATDGVALSGWLAIASPDAPTVVLVHGFKSTRRSMLPWARYLFNAGYNVLIYDSRGCGASAGWGIGVGATEPNDLLGATRYLRSRPELHNKRFAALGVSLGAGEVILAAAGDSSLVAVIADSPWADERVQLDRTASLSVGRVAVPLLPYAPALVDALVGARLEAARPVVAARSISPHALMIITSADDHNATTTPADQQRIFDAAGSPRVHWIAPSGGHAGALYGNTAQYQARTLAFLSLYLGTPK